MRYIKNRGVDFMPQVRVSVCCSGIRRLIQTIQTEIKAFPSIIAAFSNHEPFICSPSARVSHANKKARTVQIEFPVNGPHSPPPSPLSGIESDERPVKTLRDVPLDISL